MADMQQVVFKIDNEDYCVEILKVQEIIRYQPVTKIPNTPPYVQGVINLRGKVIPIISLRQRLGFEDKKITEEARVIVVNSQEKAFGIIVDSVSEVLTIKDEDIERENISTSVGEEFVKAIAKISNRLIILLDVEKLS